MGRRTLRHTCIPSEASVVCRGGGRRPGSAQNCFWEPTQGLSEKLRGLLSPWSFWLAGLRTQPFLLCLWWGLYLQGNKRGKRETRTDAPHIAGPVNLPHGPQHLREQPWRTPHWDEQEVPEPHILNPSLMSHHNHEGPGWFSEGLIWPSGGWNCHGSEGLADLRVHLDATIYKCTGKQTGTHTIL